MDNEFTVKSEPIDAIVLHNVTKKILTVDLGAIATLQSRIQELEGKLYPKERPESCPVCKKLWNPKPEDLTPRGK